MLSDITESLNQLRLANTGCDVIFEIGPCKFPAHRVVLMARMEYIRKIFTTDMRKKKVLIIKFDPLIIDSTYFGDILDFIYTSKIEFTNENIRAIYKAADYFYFVELTNKIKEHMKDTMALDNVIFFRTIAVEFSLGALEADCQQFIVRNLSSHMNRQQLIPTLLYKDLEEILHKLKETEQFAEMFQYSVDWILHNKENSSTSLLKLLKNIPMESLSLDFLKRVVSQHDLIKNDIDCLNFLLETIIVVSDSHDKKNKLYTDKLLAIIHKPRTDTLYAIGGLDGGALATVSQYNNATRKWTLTTPMPSPRSHFGCAVIDRKIYICGGANGRYYTNKLTVFDTLTQTWTQLTPMKHIRCNCGMAVLNGQIYVAGGVMNDLNLAFVERYNVQTDRWEDVAPMPTERQGLELVVLNGFLYAIGGYRKPLTEIGMELNIVERYDPQTNKWKSMSNTNYKYQAFGSAVLNGYIYIARGDRCEVFFPEYETWTEMPAPSKCRNGSLAVYNDKLYAIGGMVGELAEWKGIKRVEVFDFQARVWRPETDMNFPRCFHGVAVIRDQRYEI